VVAEIWVAKIIGAEADLVRAVASLVAVDLVRAEVSSEVVDLAKAASATGLMVYKAFEFCPSIGV